MLIDKMSEKLQRMKEDLYDKDKLDLGETEKVKNDLNELSDLNNKLNELANKLS